jgi:hypothetical protein
LLPFFKTKGGGYEKTRVWAYTYDGRCLCHDGVAAAALNDSAPFLGLDGVFLTAAEMEGIVCGFAPVLSSSAVRRD